MAKHKSTGPKKAESLESRVAPMMFMSSAFHSLRAPVGEPSGPPPDATPPTPVPTDVTPPEPGEPPRPPLGHGLGDPGAPGGGPRPHGMGMSSDDSGK